MYGKQYTHTFTEKNYIDLVLDDLLKEGWAKGAVGLELGSYRPNTLVFMEIKEKLEQADCKVVDATDIVRNARSIKSPLELQCIEQATQVTDAGMKAISNNLDAGMTELEVVAVYTEAMCKAGGGNTRASPTWSVPGTNAVLECITLHPGE